MQIGKDKMKMLYMLFLLHFSKASFDTVAYSKKTGHLTLLGNHHPRVILTNDYEDTFLVCGLRMEDAGCIELDVCNQFHSDIQSAKIVLPPPNIPFACYSKLHKSPLLPLCSIGNMTITHIRNKKLLLRVVILHVKSLSAESPYGPRFWISLVVLLFSTVFALVWSGGRNWEIH